MYLNGFLVSFSFFMTVSHISLIQCGTFSSAYGSSLSLPSRVSTIIFSTSSPAQADSSELCNSSTHIQYEVMLKPKDLGQSRLE